MNCFNSSSFFSPLAQDSKLATSLINPSSTNSTPLIHISSIPGIDEVKTTIKLPSQPLKKKTSGRTRPPPPRPEKQEVKSSFASHFLNAIENFIDTNIDVPCPSVDPKLVLTNNYAPVDELPPTECPVIMGSLPSCLDGAYIRNGPNPQFFPRGPYHLFDGDGMLHSIKISKGKATFCSRFVKTYKYITEKNAGLPLIPNLFSSLNGLPSSAARFALAATRIFTGQFNLANGIGVANTSLALFGGSLYALVESDLPYAIKLAQNGDILTLGRHDFDDKLKEMMTAHPKIDPETGEAFAFRFGATSTPYLTYFRFNADGTKEPDVPIFSTNRSVLRHDFAITKRYAVFPEMQIGIKPSNIFAGKSPIISDADEVPRLGVIPRYAKDESEMKWFDIPGLNILHAINAWDEDDGNSIVIVAPNILSIENMVESLDLIRPSMEKIKIDLRTGMVWRHSLSTTSMELGVINPAYVGKKNRYVYAAAGDGIPLGVVKLDVSISEGEQSDSVVASRVYGPECHGGEPFFIAREPDNPNADEDDGYVVCYVHDENTGESKFLVMDAKSSNLEIVAAVKLPQRVPLGFHGLFVRENDLNKL